MKIRLEDTHEAKLLIVEQEDAAGSFEGRMIRSLDSRYILMPLPDCDPDGSVTVYDVTAFEPISDYLVNRKLCRREMVGFLAQLRSVILCLEDHMLTDACLLLEPAKVMVDLDSRKVRFIAAGTSSGSFGSRFRPMAEELFRHANLDDPETLRFAAELMLCCLQEEMKLHDLLRLIEKQKLPGSVPVRPGSMLPTERPAAAAGGCSQTPPEKPAVPARPGSRLPSENAAAPVRLSSSAGPALHQPPREIPVSCCVERNKEFRADHSRIDDRHFRSGHSVRSEYQSGAVENGTRALSSSEEAMIPLFDADDGFPENRKKEGAFSSLKEAVLQIVKPYTKLST